ncbi:MAG TPA: Asp23/Gls24 family envelope stress response protein [Acidimicrobiales bacterium]|nr:Asp23/Gls24 family envelope stress response protein [Acidimicrobiales bacterium]
MSDFSAEERNGPNGPSPYPARTDEGLRPAVTATPGVAERPAAVPPRPATPPTQAPAAAATPRPRELKGRIHIADEVVEKVAGLAAMEVEGVVDLGGDFARALESVRERIGIGNKRGDQGIKADVQGHQVAISVTIMVEFGHVVLEVARQVQANVALQTQRMLGLTVVEVNVTVDDVRTPKPPRREQEEAESLA